MAEEVSNEVGAVPARALREIAGALNADGIQIRLLQMHADVSPPAPSSRLGYKLDCRGAAWAKDDDRAGVVGILNFRIVLHARAPEEEKPTDFGALAVRYFIRYEFEKPIDGFSDDALQDFVAMYGMTHLWPFARAEFQTMSAKLGLPSLTLPILKHGYLPGDFSISKFAESDE